MFIEAKVQRLRLADSQRLEKPLPRMPHVAETAPTATSPGQLQEAEVSKRVPNSLDDEANSDDAGYMLA